ncbi:MAG: VOC family protein [Myxococcota bacterium]
MLLRVDRIQLATPDRTKVAKCWRNLLGAELAREDRVKLLGAARSVLRVGTSEVELLEPDREGLVAEHLARRGGVFAAGLAAADLDAVRGQLDAQGVRTESEGGQLFASAEALGIPGLRLVLSQDEEREPQGLLRHLYEVTHLTADAAGATARLAAVFGLEASHFAPIESEPYGYAGTLTLFQPDRLDRIEMIHPYQRDKTMGRFFKKFGPSLYMCYAETDDTGAVRERLLEHAPDEWTGPREGANPDGLFIHPHALGGVMLGVSRTTFAWSWSGSPERVRAAS